MPRLDRLILKEILGPWLFGVGLFTVLIWAGSFLFKFTDYFVSGIEFSLVLKLTVLSLPAIMAKTFSMATLLAMLLAFGRLSSDSEIVALRAAGASIGRIMVPVGGFALVVAVLTFWFNESVVPTATRQMISLNTEIAKAAKATVLNATAVAFDAGGKTVLLAATEFRPASATLPNAVITTFDKNMNPEMTLYARELQYRGKNDWRVRGGGYLVSADGRTVIKAQGDLWPSQMPALSLSVEDIVAQSLKELDTFNMRETKQRIESLKRLKNPNWSQIANLEYGYYNKLAVPLAALVFGLLGAPLGIRNHRTGAAAGFWMSVLIIFGYMMVTNFMAVWAQGGKIPPYAASFTPLVIGLIFATFTIHRKN
jgi:lipopolysaccharide export system permease protein